jgi:hypothetical protein
MLTAWISVRPEPVEGQPMRTPFTLRQAQHERLGGGGIANVVSFVFALIALALSFPSIAFAQEADGDRGSANIPQKDRAALQVRNAKRLRIYAKCAIATALPQLQSAVLQPLYWNEMNTIHSSLRIDNCIQKDGFPFQRTRAEAIRYAIARELTVSLIKEDVLSEAPSLPNLSHGTRNERDPTTSFKEDDFKKMEVMSFLMAHTIWSHNSKRGECYVKQDPAFAFSLITSGADEVELNSMIGTRLDILQACSFKSGTMTPSLLVGSMSLSFFRLAHAIGKVTDA